AATSRQQGRKNTSAAASRRGRGRRSRRDSHHARAPHAVRSAAARNVGRLDSSSTSKTSLRTSLPTKSNRRSWRKTCTTRTRATVTEKARSTRPRERESKRAPPATDVTPCSHLGSHEGRPWRPRGGDGQYLQGAARRTTSKVGAPSSGT